MSASLLTALAQRAADERAVAAVSTYQVSAAAISMPPLVAQASSSTLRPCSVCLDRPKATRLRPCGHACCCLECMVSLYKRCGARVKCPVCREGVELLEWASPSNTSYAPPLPRRMRTAPEGMTPSDTSGTAEEFLEAMSAADDANVAAAARRALDAVHAQAGAFFFDEVEEEEDFAADENAPALTLAA